MFAYVALIDTLDVFRLSVHRVHSVYSVYRVHSRFATPRRSHAYPYPIPCFNSASERSISSTRSLSGKIRCASATQKLSNGSNVAPTSW